MKENISNNIKPLRPHGLPTDMRQTLKNEREKLGWSQRDLAKIVGLTQTHISGIESGRVVPRYDTLLELVRILNNDLLMVPRPLVPIVQSLIRDQAKPDEAEERSLYADGDEDSTTEPHDEV